MTSGSRPVGRLDVLSGVGGDAVASYVDDDQRLERASVTFDRSRTVRRRGAATLANHDGSLTPSVPGDLLFTGAAVRLLRGERDASVDPLATLVVASYTADMTGHLDLACEGVTSLLARPFGDAEVIASGTAPEDALRSLWSPLLDASGGGAAWVLDGGGRTMPLRSFLPDEDRLDAVVRYFAASGLEVYEDRLGRPTMRPMVDLATAETTAILRRFEPGTEATLLTCSRSAGRRSYNQVTVESNNPAGPQLRVTLTVDDPASPLHPDRIGLRPAPIYLSAQLPDLGAATALARQLLHEYALSTDTVTCTAIPDLALDVGAIVWIEEPVSGTSGRYRIETLTLPVTTGAMSFTAGRIVPLLLTEGEG